MLFAVAGAIALFDGFSLAVKEEARASYGRVVSGVVTSRYRIEGMLTTWVVDYRFPCRAYRGGCSGRDFVSEELWSRLRTGSQVSVRQAEGETTSARLDANPQTGTAVAKTALATLLFALAYVSSGRLRLRRAQYAKAPAIVTDVQPIRYGDETRWKIRFAYFDAAGQAQESIDEVNDASWKVNDDCVAVYKRQAPDLATLQPIDRSA